MSDHPPDEPPATIAGYRRLVAALVVRAVRLGSGDPESAAQEAVRRALASKVSSEAVAYFFADSPAVIAAPEWSLVQLMGWLHAVVKFVVREERARARFDRERPAGSAVVDVADPGPDPLALAIDRERRELIRDCLATLSDEHRSAQVLRLDGATYHEIARRLGVNANTLATWLRRGTIELARAARDRLNRRPWIEQVPALTPPTTDVRTNPADDLANHWIG